jgi:beta-glucanase (GH16 family)
VADILWLNGAPASKPSTLWLNTYLEGASQGEHRVSPPDYARMTGGKALASDFHTYTVDWQPDHVTW